MQRQENMKCCRKVKTTSYFTNYKNKKNFKIFHNLTCKSRLFIYLKEYVLCKLQHVGKTKTLINLCFDNHRSDVFDRNALPRFVQ